MYCARQQIQRRYVYNTNTTSSDVVGEAVRPCPPMPTLFSFAARKPATDEGTSFAKCGALQQTRKQTFFFIFCWEIFYRLLYLSLQVEQTESNKADCFCRFFAGSESHGIFNVENKNKRTISSCNFILGGFDSTFECVLPPSSVNLQP